MGENAKTPSQLTDEDIRIIDRLSLNCAAIFYHTMRKYRTPKEYAEKFLLKNYKSDKSFAAGRIVVNSFYHKYGSVLESSQTNADLATESRYRPYQNHNDTMQDASAVDLLLPPCEMTRVFRFLEDEGALFNIIGKKEIMSELGMRPVPGRPNSKNIPSKHQRRQGGRPSAYKITKTFERIRQVMEKQEAQSLLRQRLLSTSLTYDYERFCLLAIAHCARMDCTVAENLISIAALPEQLPHMSEYPPYIQFIASLDDRQLEIFVDRYYRWMAETQPYDMYFLLSFPMFE